MIADDLSAHKSRPVTDFLAVHREVHLHFTPTYSSWLNQVELWFSKIERDVIARGLFTSVSDLKRRLKRYIRPTTSVHNQLVLVTSKTSKQIRMAIKCKKGSLTAPPFLLFCCVAN